MATRQYIGARYVPKFDGVHNINKSYEPLTIVEDAGGTTSYTSKKFVPIGINLNNTEYWAITGTTSGAILDLQNRMSIAENNIDELEKIVSDKTQILIFGDSWVDVNTDPTIIIPEYIRRRFQCNARSYGYGGTGFDVPHGYNAQIDIAKADPDIDLDNIKFVVLFAGLNEYNAGTTASEFRNKLDRWTNRIHNEINADCKVYWVTTYSLENNITSRPNHTDYYTQWEYYNAVTTNLFSDVIPFLTFGWVEGDSNHWDNSWYHLTINGQREFVNNVCNAILGDPVQIYHYYKDRAQLTIDDYTDNVDFTYYLVGEKLKVHMTPAISVVASCPNNSEYTLTRNAPAKIPINRYIGQGCVTGYTAPNSMKVVRVRSQESTWLVESGRLEREYICDPF